MNKKIRKTKGVTIDALAGMVKKGFDHMDERFNQHDKRFDILEKRFDILEKRFDILSQDHEDIKLRLGNVAYRFELAELERRVNILERKVSKR